VGALSFEISEKDMLGRIGRIETKSGVFETPVLLPVVNPSIQLISAAELKEEFNCEALITNAYILKRNFAEEVLKRGIHEFLGFDHTVMTDSGAYQILVYDSIEATPEEIVAFQEEIDTDIAVILDVPTGWNTTRREAEQTVNETIQRARSTFEWRRREDILWVGPVQGGRYLDLVARSAEKMAELPFDIYALGSPTPVMEQYLFDTLVKMILTAKQSLPIEKPLHLFGAGHPMMFPFAVALGCDIFDSAAYAIFAREQKYATAWGTLELKNVKHFPCPCEVCASTTPRELRSLPRAERERLLARHNLHTCLSEIRRVRQAIHEGRLWELLQMRSRSHPSLRRALVEIERSSKIFEDHTPISKERGLLYFDSSDLVRPEMARYRSRVKKSFTGRAGERVLLLLPYDSKPSHASARVRRLLTQIAEAVGEELNEIRICFYGAPAGAIPFGLDDVYPVSQTEAAFIDTETTVRAADSVAEYALGGGYRRVILLMDEKSSVSRLINSKLAEAVTHSALELIVVRPESGPWSTGSAELLSGKIREALRDVEVKF